MSRNNELYYIQNKNEINNRCKENYDINKNTFKCSFCSKTFSTKQCMMRHSSASCKKNPDAKKKFKCEWCEKMYTTKSSMKRHQKKACKFKPV